MMLGTDLDVSTALNGSDGSFTATLSDAWELWGPSGGYIAALALRAAGEIAEIKRPASFYCHFLSSPKFDEVELEAKFLRSGRRSESIAVEMTQAGKPILTAMVRTIADAEGHAHDDAVAPDTPSPDEIDEFTWLKPGTTTPQYSFWNNIERRPVTKPLWKEPRPAEIVEWTRFRPTPSFDDLFLEASRSLILLDTYGYPAARQPHPLSQFVAPNLDTSVWFHRFDPSSEWLLIDHRGPVAERGLMYVSGDVWSADGKLLASGSAQLCQLEPRS